MPLFQILTEDSVVNSVKQINFNLERELQVLVEKNLDTFFSARFVASEFSTGELHGGRIDTLALSEENNPIIIEYKKVESSRLITQSFFYLRWLRDHKGDFEIAVRKALGDDVKVDWSEIRVICIAPNYSKYDKYAASEFAAGIELWKYRLYDNQHLYLEELFSSRQKPSTQVKPNSVSQNQDSNHVTEFNTEDHLKDKSEDILDLANKLREYITSLDDNIDEYPKKHYIGYRISRAIGSLEIKTKHIKLFLKLSPEEIEPSIDFYRDVTNIGHYGPGEAEFTINAETQIEIVKPLITLAYQKNS